MAGDDEETINSTELLWWFKPAAVLLLASIVVTGGCLLSSGGSKPKAIGENPEITGKTETNKTETNKPKVIEPRADKSDTNNLMSREEFLTAVRERTPDEVLKAVGKPDVNTGEPDKLLKWVYHKRTVDSITGKPDATATILFYETRQPLTFPGFRANAVNFK